MSEPKEPIGQTSEDSEDFDFSKHEEESQRWKRIYKMYDLVSHFENFGEFFRKLDKENPELVDKLLQAAEEFKK